MRYVLFALAAVTIFALAMFDRAQARGDTQASAAAVEHPYRPLYALGAAPVAAGDVDAGVGGPTLPAPPEIDPATTAGQGFSDFKAGKYFAGAGSVLLLLVWALRKWGGQWFKTDRGGAVLALVAGQGLAWSTVAVVGLHLDGATAFNVITAGLVLATGGAGIRHIAVNLATPPDKARPAGLENDL